MMKLRSAKTAQHSARPPPLPVSSSPCSSAEEFLTADDKSTSSDDDGPTPSLPPRRPARRGRPPLPARLGPARQAASRPAPATGGVVRRMRWSQVMNENCMRAYYGATEGGTNLTAYRVRMLSLFQALEPAVTVTAQRLSDQLRAIQRCKLLDESALDRLRLDSQPAHAVPATTQSLPAALSIPDSIDIPTSTALLVDSDTEQIDSANTNVSTEIKEQLRRALEEAILRYRTAPDIRPCLPRLPTHKHNIALMGALNTLLTPYIKTSRDLTDTHSILYCGAIAACRVARVKFLNTDRTTRNTEDVPAWEVRIERRIGVAMKKLPENIQSLFSSTGQIHNYMRAVQELVYNSLDSESTCIAIRFNTLEGKIQVIDNGIGITKSDLTFVGQRYMTSKFTGINDFKSTPNKYGWCGCSLANIIEVSHTVKITTRYSKVQETWVKSFRKGREKEITNTNVRPSRGTTVEVKGFLYNLHIQRECINTHNEQNNIKILVQQLSLVHYNKSFSLRDDSINEIILKLNKNVDINQSLFALFNIKNADFQALKVEKNQYEVEAHIGKKNSNANRTRWIYLNGIYVNNNKLYRIVNNLLNKLLFPKYDVIKKQRKFQISNNVAEFASNKALPFYFIFISCPYRDYDICYTPDQSILEFKNWDLVNNLLEKLIKFYNGEVNLLREKKIVTEIKANVDEKKDRVNNIIQKILGNTKNPGISQIQNRIKGKSIKRKTKKKKVNAPLRKLTLKSQIENENLKSTAARTISKNLTDLQAIKSSEASINATAYEDVICKNKNNRSETPDKVKNVFKNAGLEYDCLKGNNNNNVRNDKQHVIKNNSMEIVEKSKHILNTDTRNRGTNEKRKTQNKIFVNKSIQCGHQITKINSYNKKGKDFYTIQKFKAIGNNKDIWKTIKEKPFKTTYDLVQTIVESKKKYIQENETKNINHSFKMPKLKKCNPTNIKKQISYKAKSILDQSILALTYQSHDYSKPRKEPIAIETSNDYESKYKFIKENHEKHFISRHSRENFDEIKDISNNCKFLQRKRNKIENIFRTRKSYNKWSIFNFNNYKESSHTIHGSENSRCFNVLKETKKKKNVDGFNFRIESSQLNIECQTIFSNTTNNEIKFDGINEMFYNKTKNNTLNSKTYYEQNGKRDNKYYAHEASVNEQLWKNIYKHNTGIDKASEWTNNSIRNKTNSIADKNECMKHFYETFTINKSINDVLWYTQMNQDFSLIEEIVAVTNDSQNHKNFSAMILSESQSDEQFNNIDPLSICEAILGYGNKDYTETKPVENYLSQGSEKKDIIDLNESPDLTVNDQKDIIENSETENNCIQFFDKIKKDIKKEKRGEESDYKYTLQCSKVNDRQKFYNIKVNTEIVDANFHFKNRYPFIPKGMSPIFQNGNLKISSDHIEEGYYEDNIYNEFANNVNINSKIFKPDVQNLGELTTKDIRKANRKLNNENASLVFDGHSLKRAKTYCQIDKKFIAATLYGNCNKTGQSLEVFVLFDQHAVHERITLERNLSEYFDGNKWIAVELRNEIVLKLTKDDVVYMHNYAAKLALLGLHWTILNCTKVSINAIPKAILGNNFRPIEIVFESVKKLILEEIEILKSQRGCVSLYPKSIMDLVFSEACRYSIKFGDNLSNSECVNMLNELSECKTPFQCAHGRPVMAVLLDIKHKDCEYKVNNAKLQEFKNILCNFKNIK